MPEEGFESITVPEGLREFLRKRANEEGVSVAKLIAKKFGYRESKQEAKQS